jgi:Sec1 family
MRPQERLNVYNRPTLRQVIVFVAGGGSFYEYECMHKLEEELGGGIQIIYGSDYIYSPQEFMQELSKTHKK